ncbi:PIN-like domain-containing protein [Hymenobacter ruricola]|uniref:DUF4935 domain-containing protein n=1 Tax=Hymenobacter ruricola TaxID=2791023 RepID=A0ABS0I4Y4_9BACT|nr:PIN domain-containing protein [Hymenobacter ruricola]MBF9221642.1 DUF4935 domain-containing protein [Hymenobacter ruricola]
MKNLFSEYIALESADFEHLWENCVFVFDTNVLLNFYRYSQASSAELRETIQFYGNRVWIPNQVGHEFFEERLTVINEQLKNYAEVNKDLNKVKTLLMNRKGHPFISEDSLELFESIVEKINGEFSEQETALSKLMTKDETAKMVASLFEGHVGSPYTPEALVILYKEASERFKLNIPPGYKDSSKPEPNRYGDFIIWKQIIDKARAENKPVLFISDDEKEDWILKNSGKTIGPLPELIREFKKSTEQSFYIYSTFNFLKYSYEFRKRVVNQPILDEVKYVGKNVQMQSNDRQDKVHSIMCVLRVKDNAQNNLSLVYERLQNQGYFLNIESASEDTVRITIKVPFEDLVRRFINHIHVLAKEYDFEVLIIATSPANGPALDS